MLAEVALQFVNVTKCFGEQIVVAGVSFELRRGEMFGLLGPNGAGKTTLLRMAVDLLRPDSGQIHMLAGTDSASSDQFSYLPEERGLPTRARVLDFLIYVGELRGISSASAKEEARKLLKRVELDGRDKSRISELSKGNQQKVQISAALMANPTLFLLDEPFTGLDPINRALIVSVLKERVASGCAVLISTHQLHNVEELCDRMLLLNRGRILLQGNVTDIREQYADGSLLVSGNGDYSSLPSVARREQSNSRDGMQRIILREGKRADAFLRDVVEAKMPLDSFSPQLPSVEEIFVKVLASTSP